MYNFYLLKYGLTLFLLCFFLFMLVAKVATKWFPKTLFLWSKEKEGSFWLILCVYRVWCDKVYGSSGSHVGWYWVQNVKSVRVNYWVEKMETGIHFDDNVVHTDNQIRRARCWFPCIDDNNQRCWYEIIFCNIYY